MQFLRRVIGLEENAAEVEGKLEAPAHVWCVAVQGDTLHAGCADGTLYSWTLGGAISRPLGMTTHAHEGTVYALCAWPLTLVSAGADGCVRLWHAGEEGTLQAEGVRLECGGDAESARRPVLSLALNAALPSELFSGGVDRCIRRWSRDSGGWRVSQVADNAHEKEVFALALCGAAGGAAGAAALLASAGGDGAVRLWRSNDLAPLASQCLRCVRAAAPNAAAPLCWQADTTGCALTSYAAAHLMPRRSRPRASRRSTAAACARMRRPYLAWWPCRGTPPRSTRRSTPPRPTCVATCSCGMCRAAPRNKRSKIVITKSGFAPPRPGYK